MTKKILFLLVVLTTFKAQSQIIIDNTAPYNTATYLIDNVLLGGGVIASNHTFQGEPSQIGWFNAINTNLGIDSGIVMCTGDIYALDPINGGGFPFLPNTVTDPDLLAVANSVPGMIGQSFSVSSINDVAVLEFDFIPTSDSMEFRYAFGSQEYFGWENTQYNDVFGFFLSGPGIAGPWANGAINLAFIPNTNPPLPISISSVNSVTPINQQYFVNNQNGLTIADADGFTTVFTAQAAVTCGATYHIKLAIADGSDQGLSSYVWLEAGSFTSPTLQLVNSLGIDTNTLDIACGDDVVLTANVVDPGVTYAWYDSNFTVFSTDSAVTVGSGSYVVSATFPTGCVIFSDTLLIISAAEDSLPPTSLKCVAISNGIIQYEWDHPIGATVSTLYHLMGSANLNGPYYPIADVYYPATTYSLPVSSIPIGTQFCYVTTGSPCTETLTSDTLSPISFSISSIDASCWDGNNGYLAIDVHSVQLTPYTYYLDGILNTNAYPYDTAFYGLETGTYNVMVSDNAFCHIEVPITILAPGFPLQALVSTSTNTCYGSDLAFAVGSSAGGTPVYSYEWFDSGLNSFSTNDTVLSLSAGTYYLEVMDANGCDTFTTVNVIAPQLPLSASPQVFVVSCKGEATGMIVGDASGSWAPYTYYWLDMQGNTLQVSDTHISTRDTLFDLLAGNYQLLIEDFEGCSILYTFNIAEPSFALSIDSMKVIDGIACYGDSVGIARLYASGGDPAYSYLWDNGETGLIATGLTSGYHTVRLTDDWGCEVLDSLYIPENTLINSTLVANTTVSCYGLSDGVASISTLGGASSLYTYFWSQGQTTYTVNTDVAYGLLQGSYYVTTRDALGCEVVDSIYISHPEPLLMEVSEVDWIDCFGADNGEAYAYAQGGTTAYSFSWDNGTWLGATVTTLTPGVHTVVVTDARGCTATDTIFTHEPLVLDVNIDDSQTVLPYCIGVNTASLSAIASGGTPGYSYEWNDNLVQPQITSTATALLAGTYTITVTDSKGCTASDTRTIANTNTMGTSVSSLQTISCYGENDGQALVSTVGGHAPYTYEWYGPNGYGSTNDTISNLLAGVYSVTVRDTNNCMKNSSIIITQPSNMFFTTLGATAESCLGACNGQVQVNVTGGIAPYVAIATATTGNVITSPMVNNSMVTGICSGTYSLTFSDANGCSSTLINGGVNQQTISTSNTTVAQINTTNILPILCNGASTGSLAALNPNTSTGYTYSWANINNPTAILSNTTTASNLLAGTYVLYADYNNTSGCRATDTATITQLAIINPSAVITPVDCYGDNTGMLQGSVQGGTAPYTYSWNTIPIQTTQTINNLQAGSYTLTITDANNCSQVDIFDITQPQVLLASISQSGYVLTASVPTGGTSPYSYSWRKQPSTTPIGSGLNYVVNSYGTYYVVITDANSCTSQSNTITYSEGPLGTIDFSTAINLRVYPNPFREETTVDFGQRINKATIRIVDVYGKLVESYELADTDKYIIKRTNKASGIYFMEIEINKEYLNNIKLVIE